MATDSYTFKSEFVRRYKARGMTLGEAIAEARGIEKGREEGIAAGRAEGEIRSLLTVLNARFAVPAHITRRVGETTDEDLLNTWVERAISAPTLDAVFDDGGEGSSAGRVSIVSER